MECAQSECISIEDSLAFVAGELDAARTIAVEAHVDACSDCRALLVRLAQTDDTTHRETVLLAPGDRVDRYEIVEPIGVGGMGIVYAAFDPVLDRRVALKTLRPHAVGPVGLARLTREASALAQLSHPNVVAVHDIVQGGDQLAIAMELVDGLRLDAWLAIARPSWREIIATFVAVGEGLAAAHDVGLVHRDVKPSNILIGHDGRVRVGDFGIARRGADGGESDRSGTPAFMAPEQRRGEVATAASDQYSFCLALFWCLYRARPSEDSESIAFPRTPRLARRLQTAIARGLRTDPARRWPGMRELVDALRRPCSRWPRRLALGVGTTALVAAAFAWGSATADPLSDWCAAPQLAGWNDDARDRLRRAIDDPVQADALVQGLDRYARVLADATTQACTESQGDADVRRGRALFSCLSARERVFGHLVRELVAGRAAREVTRWPLLEPDECFSPNLVQLRHPLPSSPDDEQLAELRDARADLLAARMSFSWGDAAGANALLDEIASRPIVQTFPPLASEVAYVRSNLAGLVGDGTERESNDLRFAVVASATETGHAWLAAQGWLELAQRAGDDDAFGYAAIARAHASALAPEDPLVTQELAAAEARAHGLRGDWDAAARGYRDVLARTDDDFWQAVYFNELADAEAAAGDFTSSIDHGRASLLAADREGEEQLPLWHVSMQVYQLERLLMAQRSAEARELVAIARARIADRDIGPFGRGYVQLRFGLVDLLTGDANAALVAAAAAHEAFVEGNVSRGALTLTRSLALAASWAQGTVGDAAPRVAAMIDDLRFEPRDDLLGLADRVNCWAVVVLLTPTTHADRRERIAGLQGAVRELTRTDVAEIRRDPMFAWVRAKLLNTDPEAAAILGAALRTDAP